MDLHPEDLERTIAAWTTASRAGPSYAVEYRMIRPDGQVLDPDEADTLRDADGNPFVIQGLMYDITDRKDAEERAAFQAKLLDTVSDPVTARPGPQYHVVEPGGAGPVRLDGGELMGRPLPEVVGFDIEVGQVRDISQADPMGWFERVTQGKTKDGYGVSWRPGPADPRCPAGRPRLRQGEPRGHGRLAIRAGP